MSAPAPNNVDIDALLDLSEYDSYHSPALSPAISTKPTFTTPHSSAVSTSSIGTTRTLSGPSHNYDLYRQQTGFVPGAIANTMAVNESSNTGYQEFGSVDYLANFPSENDLFDFNTSPSHTNVPSSEIMDFESPNDSQLFTVNPSSIEQETTAPSPALPSQTGNVGRLWPGAHSQAALAKAQAQQRQQQQQQQQQQQLALSQQAPRVAPQQAKSRAKSPQPSDPIVEQKITQLLNSMRANPSVPDFDSPAPLSNFPRLKKEEEEMDEDERLLASEEGKKLTSKERRQLRNKVSARAFRSRRKEYISQLETEVANKVTENNDLRAQNRALVEENKRLSDLTRMLLSSPSFSNFLDHLSTNPAPPAQPAPIKTEPQPSTEQRHLPKDLSSYGPQVSQQQIGMAMIPEQNVDYSVLALNSGFSYQPRVFVVETSEVPAPVDIGVLSGKSSNFVEQSFGLDDRKVEAPVIERPLELPQAPKPQEDGSRDEEFESDPEFALFHSEASVDECETEVPNTNDLCPCVDFFGGIESEKMLSRIELVVSSEEDSEAISVLAMARVQAISASIEPVISRLELLTMDW